MEDMFSLGNVGLWRMANNGYMSLTGEVGELFITKVDISSTLTALMN